MSIIKPRIPRESTLEGLIEGLDQRGLLVFLVLLGQQSMKILSEDKSRTKILVPLKDNAIEERTI